MAAPGSDVLEAVADARWRLTELGHQLRVRPEVESFDFGVDLLPSQGPHSIPLSIWLEAVVGNGEPLMWSISVRWHDDWQIFAQVEYSVGDDIETVRELPDRRATTPEEFVQRLRETVNELVATADEVDLAGHAKRARGEWEGRKTKSSQRRGVLSRCRAVLKLPFSRPWRDRLVLLAGMHTGSNKLPVSQAG